MILCSGWWRQLKVSALHAKALLGTPAMMGWGSATGTSPTATQQPALQGTTPRAGIGTRKARTQSGKTGKKQDFK